MIANYHTHTFRCGHATGTEEEYIKRAIENGIKYMGFSDHVPFMFPGNYQTDWKVKVEDADDYIETLRALREKYKNDIEIYIGFEMEYYPEYFDDMLSFVKGLGAEYLILGQHHINGEGPGHVHSSQAGHDEADLIEYTDNVIKGMKTGAFTYVAHPDMLNYAGTAESYKREARRLCRASLELDVPIELNLLGVFGNRHYPNEAFFECAAEIGCKVIFGFDAHDANRAYDAESLQKAHEMVERLGLNYIEKTDIKRI